jgi:squalene-associated FAD-dependent desaturase
MNAPDRRPHVVIVGGGLAGLAAAVALAEGDCRVELFEAKRSLGGRAGSFRDPTSGELVDHCQHVSMGCCTNLADFCRRVGIASSMRRYRRLHFIGPEGRPCPFEAARLPAPLHLVPAFWGLKFLSLRERLQIARAMWKLMRLRQSEPLDEPTIGAWLRRQGQSPEVIARFWGVILVSALGEELDRASLSAARKVIVDGFLANSEGYVVEVPQVPLGALYGQTLERWFGEHRVALQLSAPVECVGCEPAPRVTLGDGRQVGADFVVLAVPWFKLTDIVDAALAARWPWLAGLSKVEASPITGVHLWFDRPIMPLAHAVLVGRLSQWVFRRSLAEADRSGLHYYQVVISASRELAEHDKGELVARVRDELAAIWPAAREAALVQSKIVTERAAVFSARPGFEALRPAQQTAAGGVLVAGDWTSTGWPATMESAVRSGYLAAESILAAAGRPRAIVRADLPRAWLARRLIRD